MLRVVVNKWTYSRFYDTFTAKNNNIIPGGLFSITLFKELNPAPHLFVTLCTVCPPSFFHVISPACPPAYSRARQLPRSLSIPRIFPTDPITPSQGISVPGFPGLSYILVPLVVPDHVCERNKSVHSSCECCIEFAFVCVNLGS